MPGSDVGRVLGATRYRFDGGGSVADAVEAGDGYILFTCTSSFTLANTSESASWDGTLYYSKNGSTWTEWDGTTISAIKAGTRAKLYLRGTGNTVISGSEENTWILTPGGETDLISCSGSIMALLDYETTAAGGCPTMGEYCFMSLFKNNKKLASAPRLPAMTVPAHAYNSLFFWCGIGKSARIARHHTGGGLL